MTAPTILNPTPKKNPTEKRASHVESRRVIPVQEQTGENAANVLAF